jgi:hypothetical protein
MLRHLKSLLTSATMMVAATFVATPAFAAAPDGLGPWADAVHSSSQGLQKNGQPVDAARSNPSAALGVAENDTNPASFFSLGFGGAITLAFENGIQSGVLVVEATNLGYPSEKAKVEVSRNGTDFVTAGEVSQDGSVSVPSNVGCVKYVRVSDISNPADFTDETADGYDVDGVKSEGKACPVTKDQCKHDGWKNYDGLFKNQGDCVSYVATGGKNPPSGSACNDNNHHAYRNGDDDDDNKHGKKKYNNYFSRRF